MRGIRWLEGMAVLPLDRLAATLRAQYGAIIGTPGEVVASLRTCAEAGSRR